jgi:ankyrin repeat protein
MHMSVFSKLFGSKGQAKSTLKLHEAAAADDLAALKRLLSESNVDSKDGDGRTPLHVAAETGRKDAAELLMMTGASVDAFDGNGNTPLNRAAAQGHADVVASLLARGADPNHRGLFGFSPLECAVSVGRDETSALQICRTLLDHNADPNLPTDDGQVPLMAAARKGWLSAVTMLVHSGADVNAQAQNGETPLLKAATAGFGGISDDQYEVVAFLARHGGDKSRCDMYGNNAVSLAKKYADERLLCLLERGADDVKLEGREPQAVAVPPWDWSTAAPNNDGSQLLQNVRESLPSVFAAVAQPGRDPVIVLADVIGEARWKGKKAGHFPYFRAMSRRGMTGFVHRRIVGFAHRQSR